MFGGGETYKTKSLHITLKLSPEHMLIRDCLLRFSPLTYYLVYISNDPQILTL